MADKTHLIEWLADALRAHGGSASIVDACKHVWNHHEADLRRSGDLFYTWQYDIRWAAYRLRKQGLMRPEGASPKGVWELVPTPG